VTACDEDGIDFFDQHDPGNAIFPDRAEPTQTRMRKFGLLSIVVLHYLIFDIFQVSLLLVLVLSTTYNAQRTTHNAQRITHNVQRSDFKH
jgi:hypothetical protein